MPAASLRTSIGHAMKLLQAAISINEVSAGPDWVISFLNGRDAARELISGLANEGIAVSIITCGEIHEGLLAGRPFTDGILQPEKATEPVAA